MKIKRKIKELDKLPSTRKQQFKDILKYDFALVVDISILQGLFTSHDCSRFAHNELRSRN